MLPKSLSDRELLRQTQELVQKERALLSEILQHLKEVERRKLYSDLGYGSLFEYCLRELKYSEGQAGRRIQAMKLLRDLPQSEQQEVEKKIESGALNLSNICQAQSFFNQVEKSTPNRGLNIEQKLDVLKELEHRSARQGQAALLQKMQSAGLGASIPKERARVLSPDHSELRLVLSAELLAQLQEVRGLLGPKAIGMSWGELIEEMAKLSLTALKDKKFGKRRGAQSGASIAGTQSTPTLIKTKPRSISKGKRYRVWERDGGACVQCGGKENLQVDHIVPVAFGGGCEEENLRLLCFNCNVRQGIKDFGANKMKRAGAI